MALEQPGKEIADAQRETALGEATPAQQTLQARIVSLQECANVARQALPAASSLQEPMLATARATAEAVAAAPWCEAEADSRCVLSILCFCF